ncbi:hypothetical protein RHMOL_Rhmol11G0185800 [Rhododendron molle]|uniref:Uncharacterized protein n=1 Tax=Rhododendron molle TaxID=49168 RepID=A0ACC0LVA3_RHOML|nr:hypothetical protein RHMOL_Rhmol11G0185800 [Rhododendron molle]
MIMIYESTTKRSKNAYTYAKRCFVERCQPIDTTSISVAFHRSYPLSASASCSDGGAVGMISNSRKDWSPLVDSFAKIEEEMPELNVRINLRIFCFKCPESQQ